MFVLTTLIYPALLAALCLGAGLLVDRASGRFLPGQLLVAVGAAALIGLSQLSTYLAAVAPVTPYLMAALALAGLILGWERIGQARRRAGPLALKAAVPVLVYLFALAPVLAGGRPSFSSYLALADSAIHMMGADFLLRHGQDYSHLDLRNSYGIYIENYYNSSYPSGADTFFGGSAFLAGLPLIWAFQPFNAFMLAVAVGPAWVLARQLGLGEGWAAAAAFCATVPALVFGYELIGSVKEITALPMLLTMGALLVVHARWLQGGPARVLPFALVAGAGISALGAGFGVWVLAALLVVLAIALPGAGDVWRQARSLAPMAGVGALVALICALPTWADLSGSLTVAQGIASTPAPGNLRTPLHAIQVLGAWLRPSYKRLPAGGELSATYVLIAITVLACLLGAVHLVRSRRYALAGWIAAMLTVWLGFTLFTTRWVNAKALVLTSPVVVLLAWGGVAALCAASARRRPLAPVGGALALVLIAGVLASDALQYHGSNLAPTARFEELASLNARFAGRGPTLFTDFDEYALYELRDLDVGGPSFENPPPALNGAGGGYRFPVEPSRLPPGELLAYPLLVTRRDPSQPRPPSAYQRIWHGTYYEAWARKGGEPAALANLTPSGGPAQRCGQIARLAQVARARRAQLVASPAPALIRIPLARGSRPARWGRLREGVVMSTPGALSRTFVTARAGTWEVWLQGQVMPRIAVKLDGRPISSLAGQLGGNSLVPNTMPPIRVRLSAGRHRLSMQRMASILSPGDGGTAVLFGVFLTPAGGEAPALRALAPSRWRSLCGGAYRWIEVVPARPGQRAGPTSSP